MNERNDRLRQADLAMGIRTAPRRDAAAPDHAAASEPAQPPSPPAAERPAPRPATLTARPLVHAAPPAGDPAAALEALRMRHDAECPHCTASKSHTRTVFGEGSPTARLMFIGEAPGEQEDRTGRPFVGRAGEKLDEMIAAMGLQREQVYIANALKSRPPDNRTPLQHEVDACGPYLIQQILVIRPEVIVTLGGPATKLMLGTEEGITRLRGVWAEWNPPDGSSPVPVMPTYHPAYLLRNYTAKTRAEIWGDLQGVMERLGLPRPKREKS